MPTINTLIWSGFSHDEISIIGIENRSSVQWLQTYTGQKGITFPFIYDVNSTLFNLYEIGYSFGNYPPTYIIIDKEGVVRYRTDNQYNRIIEMHDAIEALL